MIALRTTHEWHNRTTNKLYEALTYGDQVSEGTFVGCSINQCHLQKDLSLNNLRTHM